MANTDLELKFILSIAQFHADNNGQLKDTFIFKSCALKVLYNIGYVPLKLDDTVQIFPSNWKDDIMPISFGLTSGHFGNAQLLLNFSPPMLHQHRDLQSTNNGIFALMFTVRQYYILSFKKNNRHHLNLRWRIFRYSVFCNT